MHYFGRHLRLGNRSIRLMDNNVVVIYPVLFANSCSDYVKCTRTSNTIVCKRTFKSLTEIY